MIRGIKLLDIQIDTHGDAAGLNMETVLVTLSVKLG